MTVAVLHARAEGGVSACASRITEHQLALDLGMPAAPTLADRVRHAPPPGWSDLARRIAADMRSMQPEVAA